VTWTQRLPDWIGSHVRALQAIGGVPEMVVPDNLKAAVTRAHRYEPEINRTYADYVTVKNMWRKDISLLFFNRLQAIDST
jgi:transposase